MHFPERIAGAFPISCGLLIQCEPDVFEDESLRSAQRRVPLAIVHATNDPLQGFILGKLAAITFADQGWPSVRLFASDTAGHMFMHLPVAEAIRWLEAMASDDPEALVAFAEEQAGAGRSRDAIAALRNLEGLKRTDNQRQRADRLRAAIDARAKAKADEMLPKIKANADGSWVEDFLAFRDEFEFADGARAAMDAFAALRRQHEPAARRAFDEATMLFRRGRQDQGYAKYQEIVDKFYASPRYRNVKEQLRARKKSHPGGGGGPESGV
jgi:hypothetical protein